MDLMNLLRGFRKSENPTPQAATVPYGGFEGASTYSTDRAIIYTDTEAFGDAPAYARQELLRLTRYLVNNYAVVERILTCAENYSVGAGICAQAATSDSAFNDEATAYFDNWASSAFCSANNEVNLYDIQKLIVRELLIAGEIFLVMVKSPSGFPQIQLVPSENVRGTGKKNDKSVDGLFIDDFGKVTGYQVFLSDKPTTIDASNVIHIKRIKGINQKRGISAFAASLNSLRDHRDLTNLEKKAVKFHSAIAATVTKKTGEAGDGLFGRGVTKTTSVSDGRPVPNRALDKVFPGAIAYLNEGEAVNLVESNRSTDGFLKFLEVLMRDVCLNLSLPYEFVVNPSELTSAGIRFIIQDADVLFKNLQNSVIDGGLNRVYSWVVASAIKSKDLPSPKDKKYFTVSWVRPASITIDQGRVNKTEADFVDDGLISYDKFFASRGLNWKDELRQVAIEKQYIQELENQYGVTIRIEQGASSPVIDNGSGE